jgi:hypothetical protein
MMNKIRLLKIYDAIEKDDHLEVRNILQHNIYSKVKIPSAHLCGLAIIAAESNALKITQEFLQYNRQVLDKNLSRHLMVALRICKKNQIKSSESLISSTIH